MKQIQTAIAELQDMIDLAEHLFEEFPPTEPVE